MTDMQLSFGGPVARASDPSTSWAAAHDATRNADNNRGQVYRMLLNYPGGLTDFELADRTGLGDNARKRRSDLHNLGLVVDTGFRRLSPSGSQAIVWAVMEREAEDVRVDGSCGL